jgi:hypothetical protein
MQTLDRRNVERRGTERQHVRRKEEEKMDICKSAPRAVALLFARSGSFSVLYAALQKTRFTIS